MTEDDEVEVAIRAILAEILVLDPSRVAKFDRGTQLFGALPELDSMAVAGLLTEIEDRMHVVIDDDEVDGELFETFGALVDFARRKVGR